jgi:hypothetical protein
MAALARASQNPTRPARVGQDLPTRLVVVAGVQAHYRAASGPRARQPGHPRAPWWCTIHRQLLQLQAVHAVVGGQHHLAELLGPGAPSGAAAPLPLRGAMQSKVLATPAMASRRVPFLLVRSGASSS